MISKFILILLLLIDVAGAVPIVNEYSGAVFVNGAAAPQGTVVTASIDGVMLPYSSTVNQESRYSFLQATGEAGQAVKFYINGNLANQQDTLSKNVDDTFDPYIKKNLDLSITFSSGGSSSGSGGGVVSNENFQNIDKQESRDVYIHAGSVVYSFTTLDIVKEIGFDAKTSEGPVTAKIELLKGRPKQATTDAPDTVYRYLNVWVGTSGYGSSSKIENTYIVFNVPEEGLHKNNVASIKLMKLKDNQWTDLRIDKIGPDTYKAFTSGFSGFAIVRIIAVASLTPGVTITQPATSQITYEPVQPNDMSKTLSSLALLIGLFIAFGIIIMYLKRFHKPKTP